MLLETAITIDPMSGSRFTLGLGTRWMDREHEVFGLPHLPMTERFAMLEEALAYVAAGLCDEPRGTGEYRSRLREHDTPVGTSDRLRESCAAMENAGVTLFCL